MSSQMFQELRKLFYHVLCIHNECIWSKNEHVNTQSLKIWTKCMTALPLVLQKMAILLIKFGLPEKHTKFEKNLPRGFDKSTY